MAFSLGEYQDIFLEEADEQLQELNQNLLELERNPDDIDIINNIFRAAHSLKSSAAFVGLLDLSDLAHKMENLLQGLRDGTMSVSSEIVDIIFRCFDQISEVIDTVAGGDEPTQDLSAIIKEIESVGMDASAAKEEKPKKSQSPADENIPRTELTSEDKSALKNAMDNGRNAYEVVIFLDPAAQMKWVKAQLVIVNIDRAGSVITTFPTVNVLTEDDSKSVFKMIIVYDGDTNDVKSACDVDQVLRIDVNQIQLVQKEGKEFLDFGESESFFELEREDEREEIDDEGELLPAMEEETDMEGKKEELHVDHEKKKVQALKTVKVSIDKLDQLLNNVGELVIANSGFYQIYEELRKTGGEKSVVNDFKNRMEQMSRIAKDLQTGIMKTRMVPIGQVFSRFNRLVRDLAKESGKKIELNIKGEDTELDKKVIDAIGEPLMHLIRNAIDHGIEADDERKKLGKSSVASVSLNAYQGGNQIFVEVSDDGRGLDVERIKMKVLEKQLSTPEIMANMDKSDIYNFIFAPGFSTAKKVTDVSGRGVGMNVVKEIVTELNGSVAIETEPGMGTRFVLTFPLTLAIIPAIMVRVQKEMYAIPLSDVIETIKISQSDITTIEGHEVINLRGELLSLLRLSTFIKLNSSLKEDEKIPVVVVGFGNRKIGLIVDYLEGKLEIVIKSLEQNYRTVEGLAGASILGDGSICLILDVASMINKTISDQEKTGGRSAARVVVEEQERKRIESVPEISPEQEELEEITYEKEENAVPETDSLSPYKEEIEEETEPVETAFNTISEEEEVPEEETSPVQAMVAESEEEPEFSPEEETGETEEYEAGGGVYSVDMEEEAGFEPIEAEDADSEEIKEKVSSVLEEFRAELKQNISEAIGQDGDATGMEQVLDVTREDLKEFQLVANIGAANSAESLSKILGKRIDLSIPEVIIKPTEDIPEYIGDVDSIYMGVMLPMSGEAKGTLLFILHEDVGFQLIDMLYGTTMAKEKQLTEDGESALNEITNIVGSSVINVFAEKAAMALQPGLPTIVHDYMQSIIDSILVMHNMTSDYAVIMDTSFYFEDDQILGNLLLLPDTDSFKILVEGLRSNVGSN